MYQFDSFLRGLRHVPDGSVLLAHEILVYGALHHLKQGVEITTGVENDNRVEIEAKLFPSNDFQQFLQRTAPAGQSDDGIAQIRHFLFALMHILHLYHFCQPFMVPTLLHHEAGNNTGHFSARSQYGIGSGTHQADATRTVYQANAALSQQSAQFAGSFKIGGIYFSTRSTIYTYGSYLIHGNYSTLYLIMSAKVEIFSDILKISLTL